MKAHVTARVSIKADPAGVFHYISDLHLHYLWNPFLIELSPVTVLRLGKVYKSTSMLLGVKVQGENKVSKFIKDSELELENSAGLLKYRVNYRLQTKQDKTILTCTTEVSSDRNAFVLTKPVLKLLARRELQTDLKALKIAVENNLQYPKV
jgi:hypothetical protein